jgi:hypothetical protein
MTDPLGKKQAEKLRRHIPWSQGQVAVKRVRRLGSNDNNEHDGLTLGEGRWCLHTRSTVPLALISTASIGEHAISWGEVLEIPEGVSGRIRNASFHDGDIYLAAVGLAGIPAPRPRAVTVPAVITSVGTPITSFKTSPLDTRFARSASLVIVGLGTPLTYEVHYLAPTRGVAWSPTLAGATNGEFTMQRTTAGPVHVLPLGIAAGAYLDPAGNTAPSTEAMALLDWLYVTASEPDADAKGFNPLAKSFFVLEY